MIRVLGVASLAMATAHYRNAEEASSNANGQCNRTEKKSSLDVKCLLPGRIIFIVLDELSH